MASVLFLLAASGVFAAESTWNEVKKEWGDAINAIGEYSAEKKEAAVESAENALRAADEKIEQLESRMDRKWDQWSQSARKNARKQMRSLRRSRNQLSEWLGGMRHASEDAWKDVKTGFVESWNTFSESMSDAWNEYQ
jgi:carbonic anhydrase